ncbi:MAG: hypothetical protein AAB922_07740 [Patescibacteria group bacterium]
MSTTISAVFIQLAVVLLPMMGIQVGSDQLTVVIQTITVIVTGLWIWFQRVQKGDVKFFGGRRNKYSD